MRIDYVWSDGVPLSVQLINRNVSRSLSFSDHLGVEVRKCCHLSKALTYAQLRPSSGHYHGLPQ